MKRVFKKANRACPNCELMRREIECLRAIAKEAANIPHLIQKHGATTHSEVYDALHELDFELLEYDRLEHD